MKLEDVAKALSHESWVKILSLISQEPKTVSEILDKVPDIGYRESVYKALESMRKLGLIARKHSKKKRSFVYFPAFERIIIRKDGTLHIEPHPGGGHPYEGKPV